MKKYLRHGDIGVVSITAALKGYTPVFGNAADLNISKRLGTLNRLLSGVDNEILRGIKKEGGRAILTSKMRDILSMEQYLINAIKGRNMDF